MFVKEKIANPVMNLNVNLCADLSVQKAQKGLEAHPVDADLKDLPEGLEKKDQEVNRVKWVYPDAKDLRAQLDLTGNRDVEDHRALRGNEVFEVQLAHKDHVDTKEIRE